MKILRYLEIGFFLLLLAGFTSCASTKAQNPGKSETPSPPPSPVLSSEAAKPQENVSLPEKPVAQIPCRRGIDLFPRLGDEPILTTCQAEFSGQTGIGEQWTQSKGHCPEGGTRGRKRVTDFRISLYEKPNSSHGVPP